MIFLGLTCIDLNVIMCTRRDASSAKNMAKVLPDHSILAFKLRKWRSVLK